LINLNVTTSIFMKDLLRLRKIVSKPKDENQDNSAFQLRPSLVILPKYGSLPRQATSDFGLPTSDFEPNHNLIAAYLHELVV